MLADTLIRLDAQKSYGTAAFIESRALILFIEARKYPKCAEAVRTWLTLGSLWAERNGEEQTRTKLETYRREIV